MRTRGRRTIAILAALVLLGSGIMVGRQKLDRQQAEEEYAQAQALAGIPDFTEEAAPLVELPEESVPLAELPQEQSPEESSEAPQEEEVVWVDPYADALAAMDFTALRQVNGDVLGWILIPGTKISYPLMAGEDNEEYLYTTWRNGRSGAGSIFLECRNSTDLSDFNTIVYGHRMLDGSMFGSLKSYAKQSYWEKHPNIYITDDSGCKTYAVFAAYEVAITEDTYRLVFEDEGERQDFLDVSFDNSVIETGLYPGTENKILTLSTCTGQGHDTRWVVQAVLLEP